MADNNNQGFQRAPRIKNALDAYKLGIKVPCPTAPGKMSSLTWGVHANKVRITIYTGDPEDAGERTGYGKIVANIDTPVFYAFIEMIETCIKATDECKSSIQLKDFSFFGGKRSEVPVVKNNLWVGKDKDGLVWISVTADKRPNIKFIIVPTEYNVFTHGDGRPYSKPESSNIYALGYCNLLRNMMSSVLVNEYVEPAPKKPQQGNNNQGGGYAKQSYSEDIPF